MDSHIYQDTSGDLRAGLFYTFSILDSFTQMVIDRFNEDPGGVQARVDTDKAFLKPGEGGKGKKTKSYCTFKMSEERIHQQTMRVQNQIGSQKVLGCPSGHVTAEYWKDLEVDLSLEGEVAPLIRAEREAEYAMLIPQDAAEQWLASGLVGFRFAPVTIHRWVNHEKRVRLLKPKLLELQFTGSRCLRPLSVRNAPNACPKCGHEPIFCPHCGHQYSNCPKCKQTAFRPKTAKREPGDKALVVCPYEERNKIIIDGGRWDGSDFMFGSLDDGYSHIITKRALDWLLSIHAAPFYAHPALIDVAGLTDAQRERILSADKPLKL